MVEIEVSLAGCRIVQLASAIETFPFEFLEYYLAVNFSRFAGNFFIEFSVPCRLSVLISYSGWVLNLVVCRLAEFAFTLPPRVAPFVAIKIIERF